MRRFALGALPDPPDERDYQYALLVEPPVTLPNIFSMMPRMLPIRNQTSLGSCVSFGSVACKEFYDQTDLSELWLYAECKSRDGYPGEGTYPRMAMQVLLEAGVPEEKYLPYAPYYPLRNPAKPGATENAAQYRISAYAAVGTSLEGAKAAMYQQGPVAVTIKAYESFVYRTPRSGILVPPSGPNMGGHMMACVGWDDQRGLVATKNSWGTSWGDAGYCWIPYDQWSTIVTSVWTMVDLLPPVVKPWSDWPDGWYAEAECVDNFGLMKGYPDGTFHPYENMRKRHVALVMYRAGLPVEPALYDDYSEATRGWVRDVAPALAAHFLESRWEEAATRFQFVLLLSRYITAKRRLPDVELRQD